MNLLKLLFVTSFALYGTAYGYFIESSGSYLDVGNQDTLLATGDKQGSPTSEAAWVTTQIGSTATFSDKTEDIASSDIFSVYDFDSISGDYILSSDLFALSLVTAPEYFLVKNKTLISLYDNNTDSDWAVLSFSELKDNELVNSRSDLGQLTLSHVTEFNGTVVSEPATYALLLLGVAGLVGARRKHKA